MPLPRKVKVKARENEKVTERKEAENGIMDNHGQAMTKIKHRTERVNHGRGKEKEVERKAGVKVSHGMAKAKAANPKAKGKEFLVRTMQLDIVGTANTAATRML